MKVNSKGELIEDGVIATSNGYDLKECHAIAYLNWWINDHDTFPDDEQIDLIVNKLVDDFIEEPENTLKRIKNYAKRNFDDLNVFLNSL